ncbi:MAG: hypothetical protein HC789_13775 [Microcoleus sp. CSU_2_2]|nr:hypothetical protein [Microcoleus sp. SU_5_3]NJS11359.1 hypothetical protein [Microcoleus sp. CSU_2_2]
MRRSSMVDFCLGWLVATHPTTVNCQLSTADYQLMTNDFFLFPFTFPV